MSKLRVIDFYATWCGPCKVLGPVFESIMNEYPENNESGVEMKKDNVDDDNSEASAFGIRSIPTIIYIKDGVEVDRLVGVHSKAAIESKITEHLSN